ncbi:sulfotransferase domain-containing protein [Reyranella sp.]|uniref:sulfotransferase domain-containing protein n=1 Tax=Reyranella sp. TaxID=1929291 RepID=UPI003BAB5BC4
MKLPIVLERPFRHERGHCWRVRLDDAISWATDTAERPRVCPLALFEDATPLGPPHALHAAVATSGTGRFSVWQDGWLYFSASDNSDPNANGRTYRLDLSDAAAARAPGSEAGLPAAVAAATRSVAALPAQFTPGQAFSAVRAGLDALYPSHILDFAALSAPLADADLVATRYAGYLDEISRSDMVFLSIMCAGRTWIRFFLQTYLERATGEALSLVPRSIPRTSVSPSLCFTHDFFDLFETLPAEPAIVFEPLIRQRPLILLTRDLRDLSVSWYHYLRISQPEAFARLVPDGSLSAFVDSPILGIERLAAVHERQLNLFRSHAGPKLHLSYERLHAAPRADFARLLAFVLPGGIEGDPFEGALAASTFDAMQALEIEISKAGEARRYMRLGVDNWSGDKNDLKVRSGKVGRFRDLLPSLDDPAILAARYPVSRRVLDAGGLLGSSRTMP